MIFITGCWLKGVNMASIKRNYSKTTKKLMSVRLKVYKGVDENGKELPAHTKTIPIPDGLTQKQVDKFIKEQEYLFELLCKGGGADKSNIRFRDFAKEVMEIKKMAGLEISTLSRYEDMLTARIIPAFGHLKVIDITGPLLNDFYKKLAEPGANKKKTNIGLSAKTIREHHNLLSAIFTEAEKQKIISHNPARDATAPKTVKPEVNYYQPDEVEMLKTAFDKENINWKTLGYLMLTYGGRRGEFLGIKRSAIDFKNHILTISSCILYRREVGVYEKQYPKGEKIRVLPMSEEIEKLLTEYLQWFDNEKLMNDNWVDSDFIFTSQKGGMINPETVSSHLSRITEREQKNNPNFPHINSHAFRHTVASTMLANGVDVTTAADYIGDTPQTLMNNYAHVIDTAKQNAFALINNIVFSS